MKFSGIFYAAIRAQKMMDQAEAMSDLALDAALAGREREANVMSAEAAKRRKEAADLLAPYMPHNVAVSGGAHRDSETSDGGCSPSA